MGDGDRKEVHQGGGREALAPAGLEVAGPPDGQALPILLQALPVLPQPRQGPSNMK